MKKFFAILALIAIYQTSFSQAKKIRFAPIIGIGQSIFTSTANPSTTSIMYYKVGGLIDVPIIGDISLQPELSYAQQGSIINDAGIKHTIKGGMAKLGFSLVKPFSTFKNGSALSLIIGGYIGKKVVAFSDNTSSVNVDQYFNPADYGLKAGVQFEKKNVFINANYERSIVNNYNNGMASTTKYDLYHQIIAIGVGFYLL